jgi:ATP-binding cassette subfamily B protein
MTNLPPSPKRASFRALLPLLRYGSRYKGRALMALAALVVSSVATLAVPFALRRMIDFGFSKASGGAIDAYFEAMAAVVIVIALAAATRYYLVTTLGERVVADLRRDVFAHLTELDAAFYDRARTGELVSRLTADTTQIKAAFGASASIALRNLFMFVGATALMVYTSPKLSTLVLIAIPVIAAPLIVSGRIVRSRSRHAQDTLADATAFASESLGGVRTMQAFGAQEASASRFAHAVESAYSAARDATVTRAILIAVAVSLAFCSVVFVLWLGAHDVLSGQMSGGLLSQFVLFAVLAATSLGELSQVWSEAAAAAGAAGRLSELLAVAPQIVAPENPVQMPPPRGAIAFERVSFAYDGAPDVRVIDNLSFAIAPGERVALVGVSGAGKSTVFQLIMRFYDCEAGRVLVDGVDVKSVDPRALRARIAPVPQDPSIFGGTVSENIAYGRNETSEAAIEAAARRAAADGFIRELPGAYATEHGERGVALCDRAGDPQGRSDPAARRSDLGARRAQRSAGPGGARRRDERTNDLGDRPPPGDSAESRPHSRDGSGPYRRRGVARGSGDEGWRLRQACEAAIRDGRIVDGQCGLTESVNEVDRRRHTRIAAVLAQ